MSGRAKGHAAINSRTRSAVVIVALLAAGLAIATTVALTVAFARGIDHRCKVGFPTVIDCKFTW
jgi:hypothetical protein